MEYFGSEDKAYRFFDFAAFAMPLTLSILAVCPEPYWLDCPEFTAAVQTLGIPHPPGHPLYVMLTKPFTLIPLGSIAFRVSMASAVFGAIASYILFKMILMLVKTASPSVSTWIQKTTALSSALIASVAPGWWFQCVRQEVYSLQILLLLLFVYPILIFCLKSSRANDRLLYIAAFFAGLGLCNHHYITAVALPCVIPILVSQAGYRGGLGAVALSLRMTAVGAFGLMPYLFLPIRSMSGAPISFGGVHSIKDFIWVVSAKVYQKSMMGQHIETLSDRSLDALFSMMGQINPLVLVMAAAGLYFMIRIFFTRIAGVVLFLVIGIAILLRSIMGFDPFNPDYYGYMLPVLACLAAAFGFFVAVSMEIIKTNLRRGTFIGGTLAIGLAIVPILKARQAQADVDLSKFRATRLYQDAAMADAENGTLILTSHYKLFFVLSCARFIDGSRPDITVVNHMLFGYPGYLRITLSEKPYLKDLARTIVVRGNLTESTVAELAWDQPLRLEPDFDLPREVIKYMIPTGPTYTTFAEPLSTSDVEAAAVDHFETLSRLYHLLGPDWKEHETLRMLSWSHYQDALFFARQGLRNPAKKAVSMFMALGNRTPQVEALAKALDDGKKGPIDIASFLPNAASAYGVATD